MMRSTWAALAVVALLCVGGCGSSGPGNGNQQDPNPDVLPDEHGLVLLEKLPLELRRRAFQHLEEMRGSGMAPTWKETILGEKARELYRPDVEGVAYYEIPIVLPDGGVGPPCGFIVLSNGEHDFPIPHWNYEGLPICDDLQQKAGQIGEAACRIYKLDALSYVAENEDGKKVATVGTELAKIEGMDPSWLDQQVALHDASWTPEQDAKDDSAADNGIEGVEKVSGPKPPEELVLTGWESWDALKDGYVDAYGVLAEDLRRLAAKDWEVERLAEENGDGLFQGDVYRLSLMQEKPPPYTIEGDGADAQFLKAEVETRDGMPAVLVLTVLASIPMKQLEFEVAIEYDALTEVRKFGIVGPTMLEEQKRGPAGPAPVRYGPWHFFWAGSEGDQRLYEQMAPHSPPNTASCNSGCGATAWAMLFGWADRQADLDHPDWRWRWGLYRTGGGRGANAVAPRLQDSGVRNMTWEIRGHIDTWCAFSSGPTFPWDMWKAARYFQNRTGTRLEARCNTLGIHKNDLRDSAQNSIVLRGTPAIIGTGWLNHYPLAYGFAWRSRTTRTCLIFDCWENTDYSRWFHVNQGWGGSGNGWVGSGTFLYGSILP